MKRLIASFFCASALALAMITRTVWYTQRGNVACPRATSLILPCSRA